MIQDIILTTIRATGIRFLSIWILLSYGCGTATCIAEADAGEAGRPNLIIVMIDDMGWGDFSCFGNKEAVTPRIDELAAEGLRFRQFLVSSPICSPSRCGFLTGQYPQRHSITSFLSHRSDNRRRGMNDWLSPQAPSLARLLQDAGYATGHFGKWHLGGQRDVDDAPPITDYGFDTSLTNFEGMGPKLLPLAIRPGQEKPKRLWEDAMRLGSGATWMDRSRITGGYIEAALAFIDNTRKLNKPFYLNLWTDDMHTPVLPPLSLWEDNPRGRYLAVLRELDRQLGKLFDPIAANPELRDNTIIMVFSDNGPEQGMGSSGPFRGGKTTLHEGGIRSPLIVWGPGWIEPTKAGSMIPQPVISAMDLAPSLLELCGVRTTVTFDGENAADVLTGRSERPRRSPLFWSRPPDRGTTRTAAGEEVDLPDLALRDGDWKFLCEYDGSNPELYHLAHDDGEKENLASIEPDRAASMRKALLDWAKEHNVNRLNQPPFRTEPSPTPPDIMLVLADDHSQYDSSVFGDPGIPMPNLAALAKEGTRFTHCFVASPTCSPSRASLLTGLMPARHGAEENHSRPRAGITSLTRELSAAGYEVAAFGKVAHGDQGELFGFDHLSPGKQNLADNVRDYLRNRKKDKPLCLIVGSPDPHVPWPKESSLDPANLRLPPHSIDTPSTRRHRALYAQAVLNVDTLIGRLRALAAEHMRGDTLFLYTSDHGAQWAFGKFTCYDYGIRVPLVAAWPGRIPAGRECPAMISWTDLFPTFLDLANRQPPAGLDGRSFKSIMLGNGEIHRERIFATHSGDRSMNVYPIRAIRTREWKLIHNLRPDLAFTNHSDRLRRPRAGAYWSEWAESAKSDPKARAIVARYFTRPEFELYRVADDPWELNNLAMDPAHAELLGQLRAELAEWQTSQHDDGRLFNHPRPLAKPETWNPEFWDRAPTEAETSFLPRRPVPVPGHGSDRFTFVLSSAIARTRPRRHISNRRTCISGPLP